MKLIVPGTTIGVMLLPSYVEVRDKGVVKKKIRIHGKSFDYVLKELESYFHSVRKLLRPGLLEEVLIRIGLPKAEIILPRGQTPPQKEVTVRETTKEVKVELAPEQEMKTQVEEVSSLIVKTEEESVPEAGIKPTKPIAVTKEKKPSIRISISGIDDIIASSKTYVTTPNHAVDEQLIGEEISDSEKELELETSFKEDIEVIEDESIQLTESSDSTTHVITKVEETGETDSAVIKPVIEAKGLILGEDIVGRATLLSTAGFEPIRSEDNSDEIPYHFKRIINLKDHRISLDFWSFDEAVKAGIQRKEFYDSPDVVLVVYSVVDRWSFDSLTYWLKEIAVTNEKLPPIVIVGNKIDLRTDTLDDDEEPPITEKEGFDYAEELATTLARDENLHPVAFIETSCVTKEKVLDAFTIATELFIKHRE